MAGRRWGLFTQYVFGARGRAIGQHNKEILVEHYEKGARGNIIHIFESSRRGIDDEFSKREDSRNEGLAG